MYIDLNGKKLGNTAQKIAASFNGLYFWRSNSNRWYVMRGKEIIFGEATPATLSDCKQYAEEQYPHEAKA